MSKVTPTRLQLTGTSRGGTYQVLGHDIWPDPCGDGRTACAVYSSASRWPRCCQLWLSQARSPHLHPARQRLWYITPITSSMTLDLTTPNGLRAYVP